MKLFNLKKENQKINVNTEEAYIKILGTGCAKCNQLENEVKKALGEAGKMQNIQHITDIQKIMSYKVMSTPALVFGDKVISTGRVLKKEEI